MALISRAFVLLAAALALAGCNTSAPAPRAGSYYNGAGGYCWGEVSPGGPRGNLCGGGHGGGAFSGHGGGGAK
jgi:hypothetical protein